MERNDSYENHRSHRPYYADPTANTAIGNIMREEKAKKKTNTHKKGTKNINKDTGGKKHV